MRFIERQVNLQLDSAADIPAGAIVSTINSSGLATSATDTAATTVQGRAAHRATYANGDRFITVDRGVFCYGNDGSITVANVGQLATVLDNQTVSLAATTTNDIGAGYIEEVTADGVWVSMLGGLVAAA